MEKITDLGSLKRALIVVKCSSTNHHKQVDYAMNISWENLAFKNLL
jgi:hypothetical protein